MKKRLITLLTILLISLANFPFSNRLFAQTPHLIFVADHDSASTFDTVTYTVTACSLTGTVTYKWNFDVGCDIAHGEGLTACNVITIDTFVLHNFNHPDTITVTLLATNGTDSITTSAKMLIYAKPCPCNPICPTELVRNGDFNCFIQPPVKFGDITAACWDTYHSGVTPDYFTSAVAGSCLSVPSNTFGNQNDLTPPIGGNNRGYAGISTFEGTEDGAWDHWREYLKTKLIQPLTIGTTYTVSFNVKLAQNSTYQTDIGILVTSDPNLSNFTTFQYPVTPVKSVITGISTSSNMYYLQSNTIIGPSNGWVTITGTFTPTVSMQYLYIGRFNDYNNLNEAAVNPAPSTLVYYDCPANTHGLHIAYYYIDNVSVKPVPPSDFSGSFQYSYSCTNNDYSITVNPSGGQPPYNSYLWNTGATTQTISGPLSQFWNIFSVSITDANGCTGSYTEHLGPVEAPSVYLEPLPPDTVCQGSYVQLFAHASGTYPPFTISWSPPGSFNTPTSFSPYVYCDQTQSYTALVYDNLGCPSNPLNLTIAVRDNPDPPIITGSNNKCELYQQYCIANPLAGCSNCYSWIITQTSSPPCVYQVSQGSTCLNVNWDVDNCPIVPDYNSINVTVTDNHNCQSSSSFNVFQCCEKTIPFFDNTIYDNIYILNTYNNSTSILVEGTVTIAANLTIEATTSTPFTVYMQPEAKFILLPGASMNIGGNVIFEKGTCGDFMWDGIYCNDPTSQISTYDLSSYQPVFYDAYNALVSDNGGVLRILNTNFINNYIGVLIQNYYSGHPTSYSNPLDFTVSGSRFYNTNSTLGYRLAIPPMVGIDPMAGIKIKNVDGVIVGDATQQVNVFKQMLNGIYSWNSKVEVYNNWFEDMIPPPHNSKYACILALRPKSNAYWFPTINSSLTVTDNNSTVNVFKSSVYGIYNYGQPVNISGNSFDNCNYSVFCENITDNNLVSSNLINTQISNFVIGTGITAENAMCPLGGAQILISDNTVNLLKTGISIINLCGRPKVGYAAVVNNQINPIPQSNYSPVVGVNVLTCDFSFIKDNQITYTSPPTSLQASTDFRGIYVSTTQNALVHNNLITNIGSGIYTAGLISNTMFTCNTFDHCWNGFFFDKATGGIWGGYPSNGNYQGFNTQNEWIPDKLVWYDPATTTREKMHQPTPATIDLNPNNNNPYPWYYFDPAPYKDQPDYNMNSNIPNHSCYDYIKEVVNNNAQTYCGSKTLADSLPLYQITDTNKRQQVLGSILHDENSYQLYNDQYRFMQKNYFFNRLKADSNIVNLGGAEDGSYNMMFNTLSNSNIGKINSVYSHLLAGDIDSAKKLNDQISENSTWESYRKTVNTIYIKTWARDIFALSSADSATLLAIALQTPYEGGDAVITARVMLHYQIDETTTPYDAPILVKDSNEILRCYPNPTSNTLYIESSKNFKLTSRLEFYDLLGNFVHSYSLQSGTKVTTIDLANLTSGVYLCQYQSGTEVRKRIGKIVIIK